MDQSVVEMMLKVVPWVFPAGTLGMTYKVYRQHRRWAEAPKNQVDAEIIGFDVKRDNDDNSPSYFAIYRFRTSLGQAVEAQDMNAAVRPPRKGTTINVFYDRQDPTQVSTRETVVPGWGWIILALANAAFIAFAWVISSSL